jgi:hypothetical protein
MEIIRDTMERLGAQLEIGGDIPGRDCCLCSRFSSVSPFGEIAVTSEGT